MHVCFFLLLFVRGHQAFSTKSQILNIFSFGGYTVSVTTTQLYHCSNENSPGQ